MTIFWALAAALGFGIADLCAREASQKETTLKTLWYLQLIGIPTSLLFVMIGRQFPWAAIFSWSGLAGAGVGLILSVGTIFLYRALVAGPLRINFGSFGHYLPIQRRYGGAGIPDLERTNHSGAAGRRSVDPGGHRPG